LNLLNKDEFEKSIKFKLAKKNILITFHPVTLENSSAKKQFSELLKAIDELKDTNFIFTKANSDTDGDIINKMIDEYVSKNSQKAVAFASLGQLRYLSAIKFVDIVLGNSSSGLSEVPSFKKATINIGDRQKGRTKASSVIDTRPIKDEILAAITKAYSKEFEQILQDTINPYDGGNSSKKMVKILKELELDDILKKKFYDIGLK
ncbi:UDP-N-acetylglucosamine 2-epimerase, partial [Campylobacter concisus]